MAVRELFSVGDVVTTGPSGRRMTVHAVIQQYVVCRWFEGNVLRQQSFLPTDLLKHVAS